MNFKNNYWKNCWSGLIKNNVVFFKKIKKNTSRYHYQNLDDMICSSWDIEQNKLKLILGHFLPFTHLKTTKIKILKNEKICWRYHHFIHVHQKSQSYDVQFLRYGVSQTNFFVILGHFLPFYHPSPLPPNLMILNIKILKKMKKMPRDIVLLYIHVYHKWRSYDIWFLKYKVWQTEIFDNLGHFLPFQPLKNLENQNFNTEKNTWRYYHFTNMNDSHMMYGSSDMECNRHNFLSLWTDFTLLPPSNLKNQNFEKMKKVTGDIIISHRCNINDNHMMYSSWDTKCNRQNFLSFWRAFCSFTPYQPEKSKFWKNEKKNPGAIIILHSCTINQSYDVWFLRYEVWWTEFLLFWTVFFSFLGC